MTIEYVDGRKVAQIYWDDLLPSIQEALFEKLGRSNGNYDVFPMAEITLDDESDDPLCHEGLCCQKCGETQTDPDENAAYAREHPGERLWDIPYLCDECRQKDEKIKKEMMKCLFQPH